MVGSDTGPQVIHWVSTHQLPVEAILKHLTWREAVQLASTCKGLWQKVMWMVTQAPPDLEAALDPKTPDRLRIPLLTGLTAEQVRAGNNRALRMACKHGQLEVAQWLTDRFQLTADDARVWQNDAFLWAWEYGHLAMAQWLKDRFQLTIKVPWTHHNGALRSACKNGQLAETQWLPVRFELTSDDARMFENEALWMACRYRPFGGIPVANGPVPANSGRRTGGRQRGVADGVLLRVFGSGAVADGPVPADGGGRSSKKQPGAAVCVPQRVLESGAMARGLVRHFV